MTPEELATCLELLEASRNMDPDDPGFVALERAAAHLRKHAKKKRRQARRQRQRDTDQRTIANHAITQQLARDGRSLRRPRDCYVCKHPFDHPHPAYHALCSACGEVSEQRRQAPLPVSGRRALVTGGRIKIGYATALRLLRGGAEVTVTTRFPRDAARRYVSEPDADQWHNRLHIEGLDFRALPEVMRAIDRWRAQPLDILVNNAAQTVWHPPSHYEALWSAESQATPLPVLDARPTGTSLDLGTPPDLRQLDLQRVNSWVLPLAEVPPVEMVEAQVVNQIVPFLLCSQLEPAMRASAHPDRYIINVTAVEGQFSRRLKPPRHPHTNMAKAALNMLTRTSASDYAERGIHMVSVDPGWMSHEGPPAVQEAARQQGFHPPLDAHDAATRVLDPVRLGLEGMPIHGVLLKDFLEVPW